MRHDDTGPTPDYILEQQAGAYACDPPASLTKEYHPAVVDEMWRGHLEAIDAEARVPLPVGCHDEAEDRLSKILRSYANLDDLEKRTDEQYQRLKSWIDTRRKALDWRRWQEAYNLTTHLLAGKRKSVDTLYGRAGFRTKPERLVVVNDAAVINAWEANLIPQECIRITAPQLKPVHSEMVRLYKETGCIPPGCEIEPAAQQFYMG